MEKLMGKQVGFRLCSRAVKRESACRLGCAGLPVSFVGKQLLCSFCRAARDNSANKVGLVARPFGGGTAWAAEKLNGDRQSVLSYEAEMSYTGASWQYAQTIPWRSIIVPTETDEVLVDSRAVTWELHTHKYILNLCTYIYYMYKSKFENSAHEYIFPVTGVKF